MKLRELTAELEKAFDMFYNSAEEETGEIDVEAKKQLEDLKVAWNDKVIALAEFIKRIRADIEAYKVEIDRLLKTKKSLENKEEFLKSVLDENMRARKLTKFDDVSCKISYRKSEKVEIEDLDRLSEEFKKSITTINPDKIAIKDALKQGLKVDGATLVESLNIQIK